MSKALTPSALRDIQQAIDATTPGEWTYQDRGGRYGLVHYHFSGGRNAMGFDSTIRSGDAAWIARSREDALRLMDEIERLRKLLAKTANAKTTGPVDRTAKAKS